MEALVTDPAMPPRHPEGALLLAFVDVMEAKRTLGDTQGWRITRDAVGCLLEVMTPEGIHFVGLGATFDLARVDLSRKMIAEAMKGAPEA